VLLVSSSSPEDSAFSARTVGYGGRGGWMSPSHGLVVVQSRWMDPRGRTQRYIERRVLSALEGHEQKPRRAVVRRMSERSALPPPILHCQ
jgi:hypothetical protein